MTFFNKLKNTKNPYQTRVEMSLSLLQNFHGSSSFIKWMLIDFFICFGKLHLKRGHFRSLHVRFIFQSVASFFSRHKNKEGNRIIFK